MTTENLTVSIIDEYSNQELHKIESPEEFQKLFSSSIHATDIFTLNETLYEIKEIGVQNGFEGSGFTISINIHVENIGLDSDY